MNEDADEDSGHKIRVFKSELAIHSNLAEQQEEKEEKEEKDEKDEKESVRRRIRMRRRIKVSSPD